MVFLDIQLLDCGLLVIGVQSAEGRNHDHRFLFISGFCFPQ